MVSFVVVVAAGGVAVRGAAGPVADQKELLHGLGEAAGFGFGGGQLSGVGVGVEPAEPGGGLRAQVGCGQGAGDVGGDGSVAGKFGGFVAHPEQGAVGHDDVQVDVRRGRYDRGQFRPGVGRGREVVALGVPGRRGFVVGFGRGGVAGLLIRCVWLVIRGPVVWVRPADGGAALVAAGDGAAGQPVDQGVGHDLPAAPFVALTHDELGVGGQRRVRSDGDGGRQQRGQICHGVRRRPHAHPPIPRRLAGAVGDGGGVQLGGDLGGVAFQHPVTHRAQVRRQPLIREPTQVGVQAGGFPADQGGLPLGDPALFQRCAGVRQFGVQCGGQADVPTPAVLRIPPGQRDLPGHRPADHVRLQPPGLPFRGLRGSEPHGDGGLTTRYAALQRLERRQQIDALDIVGAVEGKLLDLQHPPGHHVSRLHAVDAVQRFDHLSILRLAPTFHKMFIEHVYYHFVPFRNSG